MFMTNILINFVTKGHIEKDNDYILKKNSSDTFRTISKVTDNKANDIVGDVAS